MKLEGQYKPFDVTIDSVRAWLATIMNPSKMCRSILDETPDTADAITRALKIWFVGALVTILFAQGAIYRFYNIDPFSLEFYSSIAAILLVGSFLLVLPVYCAFFIFRLSISFRDTFVTFLVLTAVFFPLIALASTPVLVVILEFLRIIKTHAIDLTTWNSFFTQIGGAFMKTVESNRNLWAIWSNSHVLTSLLPAFLFAIQVSIIFNFLSARYQIERIRVFDAGTFGLVMGGSLIGIVLVGYLLTLYTFMGK